MGNDLCNFGPQEQLEKIQYNPDDELVDQQTNKMIRRGQPSLLIAYNINSLPQDRKESSWLTDMQEKIAKFMKHQKRNLKPITINKPRSLSNYLPDPYYIHSLKAFYIGEWILDKNINQVVPGGLGRLYTQDCILQGEIESITNQGDALFSAHFEQPNMDFTRQMVQHNAEKAKFFSVIKQIKKEEEPIIFGGFDPNDIIHIKVVLNGQGRRFTRNTELKGIFSKGELSGKGYCRIKQGEDVYQYTGEYKAGKKYGKGVQKYKLTTYDGDFVDDRKQGSGTLTLLISRAYDKERLEQDSKLALVDKERDPAEKIKKITLFINQRKKYQAKLNALLKQKLQWEDPKLPQAFLTDNQNFFLQHHRRVKFLENYKGNFKNNQFDGQGTYAWFNGKCYCGQWQRGKMQGIGQFYWPKDIIYRGQYQDDKRHGKGIMIWSLAKRFRGNFAYGFRHGYGELIQIQRKTTEVDKKRVHTYELVVKGVLYNVDVSQKVFFEDRRPIDDIGLYQLQLMEKQTIAFIKDIKIDVFSA